ncbi:MAG TPA: MBL fold metallo-hydrolase [Thermoanaerobaculia bacterium]|nr:MBL fold metallo-hydrolase [Thermoanaerobaculia bacterium]HUM31097.1 MBL fold metallo-hydrolase [Thermoanaerobaculia bacterium]HXK69453.1 MBL fold metallo-hydrolase [Thermoanaerobaculia bacterium]
MKTIRLILILALFPLVMNAQEATVKVTPLNDHLYRIDVAAGFTANVIASVGEDGILLVDTGLQAGVEKLKKALTELGKEKGEVKYIILTHEHPDHAGGLAALGPGATVIAHKGVRNQLTSGTNILLEIPESALPTITIDAETTLHVNGEEIRILPLPGSHSDTDMAVYFVESKIVCMGGLGNPVSFPYVDRGKGGSFAAYPGVIQKLMKSVPKDVTFVPGHGDNFGIEQLKTFSEMLLATKDVMKKALDEGLDAKMMKEKNILKEWESYQQGFVNTGQWIDTVVPELIGKVEKPVSPPIEPLFHAYKAGGIEPLIEAYNKLKQNNGKDKGLGEGLMNTFGYYLLGKGKTEDAIKVFTLNVKEYPEAFNVYDSLAEAYMVHGEKDLAVKYYKKALEINPEFENAKRMLQRLTTP